MARPVSWRRGLRMPLVITEHTGPFDLLTRNAFMRHRTRRSVSERDRVFAVSNSLKQAMLAGLALTPDHIEVLPNGVDQACFIPWRRTDHAPAITSGSSGSDTMSR